MTLTPSAFEIMSQAADLLDAILTASGTYMTTTQKARAAAVLETRLSELRRRWAGPLDAVSRQRLASDQ